MKHMHNVAEDRPIATDTMRVGITRFEEWKISPSIGNPGLTKPGQQFLDLRQCQESHRKWSDRQPIALLIQ